MIHLQECVQNISSKSFFNLVLGDFLLSIKHPKKIVFIVSEDWYFYSHRLGLAKACLQKGWEVVVITRVGTHENVISDEGIKVIPSIIKRGKVSLFILWNDFKTVLEFFWLIKKERPTILHLVGLKPMVFGGIAAFFLRPPLTVNALSGMGYVFTSAKWSISILRFFLKFILKFVSNRSAALMIVQNKDDKEDLLKNKIVQKKKCFIVRGSGVDLEKFPALDSPEEPVTVAFVGRILKDKGVNELAMAARELALRRVKVKIIIVGKPDPGNPSSLDEEMLIKWTNDGLLHWIGFQNNVWEVWRTAHIAVLPSYREGLPLSLLEASAVGRPLIAADVQGSREIVQHGRNGFLVPPRDWVNLANAIEELVISRETRVRMGIEARKIVEQDFSLEIVNKKIISLYEQNIPSK